MQISGLCVSRYPIPKEVCVFSTFPAGVHTALAGQGTLRSSLTDSVQEPRRKAHKVKFGIAQALAKDAWARDQLSADLP